MNFYSNPDDLSVGVKPAIWLSILTWYDCIGLRVIICPRYFSTNANFWEYTSGKSDPYAEEVANYCQFWYSWNLRLFAVARESQSSGMAG